MNGITPHERPPAPIGHSIWLRLAGFTLGFAAAALIVLGVVIGLVGLIGGLLVRVRPEMSANITYDPSTVTLLSPLPLAGGVLMLLAIRSIAGRMGATRR